MAQTTTQFPAGTCLDITFADHGTVRYLVEGEYEKYGGLKVKRVHMDPDSTLPRYCGSLFPDEGILRDNLAEEETERTGEHHPETYDIEGMDVVPFEDRIDIEGEFASPQARHVKRAVIDAIDDLRRLDAGDAGICELVSPKDTLLQGAGERSDTDCVTFVYIASFDLWTEEQIRETLRDHLKDDYSLHTIRSGVWEFRHGPADDPVQ